MANSGLPWYICGPLGSDAGFSHDFLCNTSDLLVSIILREIIFDLCNMNTITLRFFLCFLKMISLISFQVIESEFYVSESMLTASIGHLQAKLTNYFIYALISSLTV